MCAVRRVSSKGCLIFNLKKFFIIYLFPEYLRGTKFGHPWTEPCVATPKHASPFHNLRFIMFRAGNDVSPLRLGTAAALPQTPHSTSFLLAQNCRLRRTLLDSGKLEGGPISATAAAKAISGSASAGRELHAWPVPSSSDPGYSPADCTVCSLLSCKEKNTRQICRRGGLVRYYAFILEKQAAQNRGLLCAHEGQVRAHCCV